MNPPSTRFQKHTFHGPLGVDNDCVLRAAWTFFVPAGGALLHLGDKLAHLCLNKDFVFLRASVAPQVCVRTREAGVGLPAFCCEPFAS